MSKYHIVMSDKTIDKLSLLMINHCFGEKQLIELAEISAKMADEGFDCAKILRDRYNDWLVKLSNDDLIGSESGNKHRLWLKDEL